MKLKLGYYQKIEQIQRKVFQHLHHLLLEIIIILQMTDSFTKQKTQYLLQLLCNHQSIDLVQKIIQQTNSIYERKIENGYFVIQSKSYSLSSTPKFSEVPSSQSRQSYNQNINRKEIKTFTEEQRLQFLKKIRQQKIDLKRKKEQHAQVNELKKKIQIQEQQIKQREENQKKELKRKQIQKRLQELSQQKIRRQTQIKMNNRQYQQISKRKILLHRIQENYQQLKEQSIRERNERLSQIRQEHRPIDKSQFEEHAIRIDQYLEKKLQNKNKQQSPSSANQFYKSHWYKQVLNEQKIDKFKEQQEKKNLIKVLKDNQKQYAQSIRIYFPPTIDEALIQEIQQRQAKPIKTIKAKQIRQMGLNNLKYSKNISITKEQAQVKKHRFDNNQKLEDKKKSNDYLKELKTKRRSNSLQQLFLDKGKESISKQNVQYLAAKLQQKARQNQKLHKIRRQVLSEDVDEMYMRALNAKLNLLGK